MKAGCNKTERLAGRQFAVVCDLDTKMALVLLHAEREETISKTRVGNGVGRVLIDRINRIHMIDYLAMKDRVSFSS
jgi:hypothetical protein